MFSCDIGSMQGAFEEPPQIDHPRSTDSCLSHGVSHRIPPTFGSQVSGSLDVTYPRSVERTTRVL